MTAVMSSSQEPMVMVSMILNLEMENNSISSLEKVQIHLVTGDSIHLRYPGEHRLTLEDVASVYEVSQRSSSICVTRARLLYIYKELSSSIFQRL